MCLDCLAHFSVVEASLLLMWMRDGDLTFANSPIICLKYSTSRAASVAATSSDSVDDMATVFYAVLLHDSSDPFEKIMVPVTERFVMGHSPWDASA